LTPDLATLQTHRSSRRRAASGRARWHQAAGALCLALAALLAWSSGVASFAAPFAVSSAAPSFAGGQDDVDAFMEKALARREINWQATYDYVFNEVEKLSLRGAEIAALQSFEQEYTWYVRDGYLVRSPWSANGVEVGREEREAAELAWIADVERDESTARIQRDSFFDFEFEPGNYLFAGREVFEGREVVRIEYYPTRAVFSDDDDEPAGDRADEGRRRRDRDEDDDFDEDKIGHMFAKTSRVSMLILPEEHQIVHWTFENVGFEFLPYRWLVRLDELYASMTMDQPIEGVWLPREIRAAAKVSTASFALEVEYSRRFGDYKEPAVGAGVIFGRPKREKR
jgi:hypothetical protein